MKNVSKKIAALVAAGTMALTANAAKADFYSTLFQIVDIDREEHVVTVVDCNGTEFQFEEDDDWYVSDFLTAVMDDNGTEDTIEDDVIVSTRYERPDLF